MKSKTRELRERQQKPMNKEKSLYNIYRSLWNRNKYQKTRYIQEQEDLSCGKY